jgi:hypothetical protein
MVVDHRDCFPVRPSADYGPLRFEWPSNAKNEMTMALGVLGLVFVGSVGLLGFGAVSN